MGARATLLLVVLAAVALFGTAAYPRLRLLYYASKAGSGDWRAAEAACAAKLKREVFAASPAPGFRAQPLRAPNPPSRDVLRLATLRLPGDRYWHYKVLRDSGQQYLCMMEAAQALGGNTVVVESIDSRVPGLKPSEGELVATVYLEHAGALPEDRKRELGGRACRVAEVFPGTPAARAGLREGDLLFDVDDARVPTHGGGCGVIPVINSRPPGATLRLVVLRDGLPVDLSLTRESSKDGFAYSEVPIL